MAVSEILDFFANRTENNVNTESDKVVRKKMLYPICICRRPERAHATIMETAISDLANALSGREAW